MADICVCQGSDNFVGNLANSLLSTAIFALFSLFPCAPAQTVLKQNQQRRPAVSVAFRTPGALRIKASFVSNDSAIGKHNKTEEAKGKHACRFA